MSELELDPAVEAAVGTVVALAASAMLFGALAFAYAVLWTRGARWIAMEASAVSRAVLVAVGAAWVACGALAGAARRRGVGVEVAAVVTAVGAVAAESAWGVAPMLRRVRATHGTLETLGWLLVAVHAAHGAAVCVRAVVRVLARGRAVEGVARAGRGMTLATGFLAATWVLVAGVLWP